MNTESVITERGQITLPKELRDRLGLKPGTTVQFKATGKGILIQKGSREGNPFQEVFGIIHDRQSTDDYLRKVRGKVE